MTSQSVEVAGRLEVAHVLFMDVVGYSLLSMEQQEQTMALLQGLVRQSADFVQAEERGALLCIPAGDGLALVFWDDAEAPARCALEVSAGAREHSSLRVRMGIHTGPVKRTQNISGRPDLTGNGITIAQRVMDCGDAGHILLSDQAAALLGETERWRVGLRAMGECRIKHGLRLAIHNLSTSDAGNPERPSKMAAAPHVRRIVLVATAVLVLAAGLGSGYRRLTDGAGPTTPTLALPPEGSPAAAVIDLLREGEPGPAALDDQRPALRLEVFVRRHGESEYTALADGEAIASGQDRYVVVANAVTAGYLYLVQVDSSGQVDWLFPGQERLAGGGGAANPLVASQVVQVPPAESGQALYLDTVTGVERIYAAFSATRWAELEDALAAAATAGGVRPVAVARRTEPAALPLTRGVGGTLPRQSSEPLTIERLEEGRTTSLPLTADAAMAARSYMVLQRWFQHVAPGTASHSGSVR